MSDAILKELCNGIFTIALNRPEKLNCINIEMLDMLQDCIAEAEENDEIRIVVIEGKGGRAFSTGGDLKVFEALDVQGTAAWIRKGHAIFERLQNLGKPTVAVIQGYAYGGGLELALACDFRLATEDASFCLPELLHGWPPGWGALRRLERLIGEAHAKEMILLAQPVNTQRAFQYGLITAVAAGQELPKKLQEMTTSLLKMNSDIYAFAKAALQDPAPVGPAGVAYDALAALYSRFVKPKSP